MPWRELVGVLAAAVRLARVREGPFVAAFSEKQFACCRGWTALRAGP